MGKYSLSSHEFAMCVAGIFEQPTSRLYIDFHRFNQSIWSVNRVCMFL